jgi:hypothetical protein
MLAIAVGGETGRKLKTWSAAGIGQEQPGPDDRAGDLGDDVGPMSLAENRPPAARPTVTAGLRWHPDMWPIE